MYCVWNGWIIQLILFLAVVKLTLNYLYIRYTAHTSLVYTLHNTFTFTYSGLAEQFGFGHRNIEEVYTNS